MNTEPEILSLGNPVFVTYLLTASIMLLKLMLQPWVTVMRMMKARGVHHRRCRGKSLSHPGSGFIVTQPHALNPG